MAVLGIELGSTRIKAVAADESGTVVASGTHDWENQLEDGVWTYRLGDVWAGLVDVVAQVRAVIPDARVEALGISAMMHGYLVFGKEGHQLVPFRTWRNTMTEAAAAGLSDALQFNIPQRWSAAHLCQAVLNGESHVSEIDYMTTLAGYVHGRLTGERCLGIGDASGMFPVGREGFDQQMLKAFEGLLAEEGCAIKMENILPRVLLCGEQAGRLTEEGASLLDPSGWLAPGTPLCPPEGDAGTGMVATNSTGVRTGNVSAGTSVFAMVVLEEALHGIYKEVDMVTTPAGSPVAMVHCNNCTTDIDAWFGLFGELLQKAGAEMPKSALYDMLYACAMGCVSVQSDAGGLVGYNYYSGEPITCAGAGVPLFMRHPASKLALGNFCRSLLFSSVATLRLGMDILTGQGVHIGVLQGHGGFFKTEAVGQRILASALGVPVEVAKTAGEGGAWGIALLAGYLVWHRPGEGLEDWLGSNVFSRRETAREEPDEEIAAGFAQYMQLYKRGLAAERVAADALFYGAGK